MIDDIISAVATRLCESADETAAELVRLHMGKLISSSLKDSTVYLSDSDYTVNVSVYIEEYDDDCADMKSIKLHDIICNTFGEDVADDVLSMLVKAKAKELEDAED